MPTFRDAQTGLWAKYSPEELATPRAFRRNPRLVWEWYAWRRKLVAEARPNSGHLTLVEMEQLFPQFRLITQNVDGLHQRAGSRRVIELLGIPTLSERWLDSAHAQRPHLSELQASVKPAMARGVAVDLGFPLSHSKRIDLQIEAQFRVSPFKTA